MSQVTMKNSRTMSTINGEVWESPDSEDDRNVWAGLLEVEASDSDEIGLHIKAWVNGDSDGDLTVLASIYISESTARELARQAVAAADEAAPEHHE